jgi:uncharacterized protein YyaL (SSP411 family)
MSSKPAAGQNPPNHLIREKSPYLQQHVNNPVDWYPWGDEAFRRATKEQKPVFLSIGYATCHWCHVMAHESFEDHEVAAILNTHFIAVKVDREERPDIDSVYMTACQHMTGQGGWPLTIIMTPDKKPFFAGTYLPRKSRTGMTGLEELLRKVARLWQEQRDTLVAAAEQLTFLLEEPHGQPPQGTAGRSLLQSGYEEIAASFDPVNGGFGRAPKFPTPTKILFLVRYSKRTGSDPALRMAEQTLDAMRCGGIHDHLGGGFHRYSTDTAWRIPHFEKMLYDQALLLMAFTEAWLATKNPAYRKTAEGIVRYVTRDLSSPEGAFISAEDADSPGGEGAFYLWTKKELDDILGPRDGPYAAAHFHVRNEGNFFSAETGPGKNILYLQPGNGLYPVDDTRITDIRNRLLAGRQKRPRPQRDGKILTDWNGLMIAALAQSSRAFENPEYYRAAKTAMHVILDRLQASGGGLLHRYCDGEAAIPAFADDYAFVIRALIELYETSFDPAWLEKALNLDQYLRRHFSDTGGTGFFTTSDEGEALITRKKEVYDGALPSCNSIMLGNLVLLGHLTGDPVHDERASRLADGFAGIVLASPSAYSAYLCGLDHLLGPVTDVVIAGERYNPGVGEFVRVIRGTYLPSVTVHFRPSQASPVLDAVAPFTRTMAMQGGKTTAYVCTGHTCSVPVTTVEALRELLGEKK